jgi:hypothetical protein
VTTSRRSKLCRPIDHHDSGPPIGRSASTMFTIEDVAAVDLPPVPEVTTAEALDLTLENTPRLNALADDAPLIGVIDSGLNDHSFLANIIAGAIGVPADLGTADDWGHGTRVAGVAVFGDLRAQLAAGTLQRGARLCAAKVVNERGEFDDRRLVPSQMREALTKRKRGLKTALHCLS